MRGTTRYRFPRGHVIVRVGFTLNSLFLAVVVFLVTAVPCQAAPQPHGPAPGAGYVDPATCAHCHSGIAESYSQTGMGRSLFKPTRANTLEDYINKNEFFHALSDTHYSMIVRDGAYYQRRWQTGFDGTDTNIEEIKIDYVLGAGDHARSYLHRTARGSLIELPLGWYSERAGYWGMNPGFDSRHPQTRRMVSYDCIFCHDAYPRTASRKCGSKRRDPSFLATCPKASTVNGVMVPVRSTFAWPRPRARNWADISRSIVNPARLSPKLQMDVCMQCHLEPTTGSLPSLMTRFNRRPFSYIPGQPLEDFRLYFDFAPGTGNDDRFELVSAAYRLRKSRCFLESKGALTCLTCHNPHQVPPKGEEAVKYYSHVCLGCHESSLKSLVAAARHTDSTDCVKCHMPERRTEDVVHASITDHLIQRHLPPGDLLAEIPERHLTEAEEYRGEVVPYYPSPLPRTGENMLYKAVAQVALQNNLQQGLLDLSKEIRRLPPAEPEFYTALGDAWRQNSKPQEAVAAFEQALQLKPNHVVAMLSLAGALNALGKTSRSEEVLNRASRVAPLDADVWYQYGRLDAQLGRSDGALEKLQKAISLNPNLPGVYTNLAGVLAAAGQMKLAEDAARQALAIDPYDGAAYDLSGRVLAANGKTPEALYAFEKATRVRKKYEPYLYDYALMLARLNRFDDAEKPAEDAVRADPNSPEAHYFLGGLFARRAQFTEAEHEYLQTVQLRPDFSRAQLDLGLVLAREGDLTGAAEHLRKAADGSDAAITQQANSALQQIGKH